MVIDFYLDPACPWCWGTSRWLLDVQRHRDFTIRWQPMSLWRKNQGKYSGEDADVVRRTHAMLRVCEAVREASGNDAVGAFYTVIGTATHHDGVDSFDLGEALSAAGCDPSLAAAAADERWDEEIARRMDEGLRLAGDDIGTPLLAFDERAAFFGPIMSPIPTGPAALRMFDAVTAMTTQDGFWELKRTRTVDPAFNARPEVAHLEAGRRVQA